MMNTDHHPTDGELVAAITKSALAAGIDREELRGLLLAERANGILRDNCPRWLRQTKYFLAQHGKLYPIELVAKSAADYLDVIENDDPPSKHPSPSTHRGARD